MTPQSSEWVIFLWGVGGSIAVEVVTMWGYYEHDRALPERYKQFGFWVVRALLAIMGGGLALAYEIQKPLLAANIGAATPLIIRAFAAGLRPTGTAIAGDVPVAATSKLARSFKQPLE